ncbi:MAG: deoxyhypusine synthase [Thaumarchaeota archaeon]|nr:deoxyhypusine synthase [Nitrososphaerota archaeon]
MKRNPGLSKVRDIHALDSEDVVSIVDEMGQGGGFMAKHLQEVCNVLVDMNARKDCVKFLSFPADIVATGARGLLVDLVREGMVDVIITTCGTLDHDIARTLGEYYGGRFGMDDAKLHRKGFHRLGNVLVPLDGYGPLIEKRMQAILGKLYRQGVKTITTEKICSEIGRDLDSKNSLLYWAQERGVPVFVPGITDGAVGSQLWLFAESHRDFKVDLIGDEKRLSDITSEAKATGALVLGGGISKHHLIWWNLFRGGLDYACYVTTASELDGSLSGAQVSEAVSWGKVKERAMQANLNAEVTTVLPFIVSYILTKARKRR